MAIDEPFPETDPFATSDDDVDSPASGETDLAEQLTTEAISELDVSDEANVVDVGDPVLPEPPAEEVNQANLEDLVAELDRQSMETEALVLPEPDFDDSDAMREENLERFIQFTLAGTRYAVPVGAVIEVAEIPQVTPVPNVPAWVLGVSNLRGEILAVIDLRTLLELPQSRPLDSGRILVARSGQEEATAGLVVDEVNGAAKIDPAELRPPTAEVESKITPYLMGVANRQDRVLAVLDLAKLLESPEVRRFGAV